MIGFILLGLILLLVILIIVLNKLKTKAIRLLSDLADLQNGAPLETYKEEWEKTMYEVHDFLNKYE